MDFDGVQSCPVGIDPTDFKCYKDHPELNRIVSRFLIFSIGDEENTLSVYVSWKYSLLFRRFVALFPEIHCFEYSEIIPCKLSRFNLNRIFNVMKVKFNLSDKYDKFDFNNLDEDGILRLRRK